MAKNTSSKDAEKLRSRAPVAAPGKKHRKPPPQEAINTRLGEKVGKKVGQKDVKNGPRRGRG